MNICSLSEITFIFTIQALLFQHTCQDLIPKNSCRGPYWKPICGHYSVILYKISLYLVDVKIIFKHKHVCTDFWSWLEISISTILKTENSQGHYSSLFRKNGMKYDTCAGQILVVYRFLKSIQRMYLNLFASRANCFASILIKCNL